MQKIKNMIADITGVDIAIIGEDVFSTALRDIVEECAYRDIDDYYCEIMSDNTKLHKLIEKIIVCESWFFRDEKPFELLVEYGRLLLCKRKEPLRCLSIGCSHGEEPYSMAMALLDEGLPFIIDGVDISRCAIEHAENGVYTEYAFRSNNRVFRDKYFECVEGAYKIADTVKKNVHFFCSNIFDYALLENLDLYDIIFCRNVLIYFNRCSRNKLVSIINKMLHKNGILVLGHSEVGDIVASNFVSMLKRGTFSYRKKADNDE